MGKSIFNEIISELKESIPKESTTIELSEDYDSFDLKKENFHKIDFLKSDKKIAFVDGGNAEIISAPNFSLHFIRVYYTIYLNNKRIKTKKIEFYSLATAFNKGDEIYFKTKIFPLNEGKTINENDLIFNSNDKTLKTGKNRFSISKIGEIARRFAELKICENLIDESKADFIILDGDLESNVTNETLYLKNLFNKSMEENIIISAISKTSRLFTNTGDSFNSALNKIAPDFPWFYYPVLNIKNNDKLKVGFIKLNQNSRYIFKFEILNDLNKELFLLLMENSVDPVFLGYPYGLIEADKFARVSNKEREYLKTVFMAKAGKDWEILSGYLTSVNAHNLLDNLG